MTHEELEDAIMEYVVSDKHQTMYESHLTKMFLSIPNNSAQILNAIESLLASQFLKRNLQYISLGINGHKYVSNSLRKLQETDRQKTDLLAQEKRDKLIDIQIELASINKSLTKKQDKSFIKPIVPLVVSIVAVLFTLIGLIFVVLEYRDKQKERNKTDTLENRIRKLESANNK